jgi:O-antigen biosynthesis protein WbqV
MLLSRLTSRQMLIVAHDLLATLAAICFALLMRFDGALLEQRLSWFVIILPGFAVWALVVFYWFDLHRTKWRFISVPDLTKIVQASTVLAVSLLVLDYILLAPNFLGTFFFGKVTILLYWILEIVLLSTLRFAYRYFRYTRTLQKAKLSGTYPALIIGRAADAEVLLRAIESGAVSTVRPVGLLSPSVADRGQSIRGVLVLGDVDDLERVVQDIATRGTHIQRIVLTSSALEQEARPETILIRARRLNIGVSRLSLLESGGPVQLAPVAVEDLLLRPSVTIDYERLENFVRRKSIVVTGGGGSIGAEICDRVVSFGAARVLVIENSEPALHAVLGNLAAKKSLARIEGRLADARDRQRMIELIADFRPDIVFHAAALKHVDLLEQDWDEGIKTNIFGSVNVADAAAEAGAAAMVMISTDKAIEPVSVLGVTKRFAEMYCQALDSELAYGNGRRKEMRLVSVRFGNVLASNGSVVPKFKSQIEAGGPITVTHKDMVRYFMTIREACDLVVTAASHALSNERADVSVYTLNMGQPVRILDLAERMIRLSGLEPGRDINIVFTGLRPGERLQEFLFAREEPSSDIGIAGIVAAKPVQPSVDVMRGWLERLKHAVTRGDRTAAYQVLGEAVPDFRSDAAQKARLVELDQGVSIGAVR